MFKLFVDSLIVVAVSLLLIYYVIKHALKHTVSPQLDSLKKAQEDNNTLLSILIATGLNGKMIKLTHKESNNVFEVNINDLKEYNLQEYYFEIIST